MSWGADNGLFGVSRRAGGMIVGLIVTGAVVGGTTVGEVSGSGAISLGST
jgi:hypothetical protein